MKNKEIKLSVVVPIYNEEKNIKELLKRISGVLEKENGRSEIICVDDSSSDGSLDKLKELKDRYENLRVISLNKHMGQSAAMAAGFKSSLGTLVATLDADMQCVPEDIPKLIDKLGPYDSVCPIREKRKDTFVKKVSSAVGNGVRNFVTGEDVVDTNCPLKLFRREAILSIPYFRGFHRFIPTLLKTCGYSYVQMGVKHYPRKYGKSKYNILNRLFKGLTDTFGVLWLKRNEIPLKVISKEI